MGGTQFPKLNDLFQKIWQCCEKRNLWIYASHINTKDNIQADNLSRTKYTETEWTLADWVFNKINISFGPFEIDLFASNSNKKCKKRIPWFPDPFSFKTDAFTITCNSLE